MAWGPSCIGWIETAELSGRGMVSRSGQSGAARRMCADLRTWFAGVSVGDDCHTQDPVGSLQSADSAWAHRSWRSGRVPDEA